MLIAVPVATNVKLPKAKDPRKGGFIRDIAQESTLAQWRKGADDVHLRLIDGQRLTGKIISIGVFSIRVQTTSEDICIFKTAIATVAGKLLPKAEPIGSETVHASDPEGPAVHEVS